jgi:AcrR family transcriptional regulator
MKKIPAADPKKTVVARKAPATRPAKTVARNAARSAPAEQAPVDDIRDAVSRLKRERIISTAVDLFHNYGLSKTTLEAVAKKMNVTKPFIYSHFKSKDDLLAEICSRGIRASLDVLNRVVQSEGTPTEKVRAMARDFMLAVIENQGHIAIYTREEKHMSKESRDNINKMRREFDRKICELLDAGVASGEFVVDDVHLASLSIGGLISWSYVWYRAGGRLTPVEVANKVADLVLAMIQAKPARGGPAKIKRSAAKV